MGGARDAVYPLGDHLGRPGPNRWLWYKSFLHEQGLWCGLALCVNELPASACIGRARLSPGRCQAREWGVSGKGAVPQVAASLAFTSLLSLVPLCAGGGGVAAFRRSGASPRALQGFLLDNLLPDERAKVICDLCAAVQPEGHRLRIVGGAVPSPDGAHADAYHRSGDRPDLAGARWQAVERQILRLLDSPVLSPALFLAGGVLAASMMLTASMDLLMNRATPGWGGGLPDRSRDGCWLGIVRLRCILPFPTARSPRDKTFAELAVAALGFFVMQRLGTGLYLVHFPSLHLVYGRAFAVVPLPAVAVPVVTDHLLGRFVATVLTELTQATLPNFRAPAFTWPLTSRSPGAYTGSESKVSWCGRKC